MKIPHCVMHISRLIFDELVASAAIEYMHKYNAIQRACYIYNTSNDNEFDERFLGITS